MSKKRERSEVEHLKGIIRQRDKEIRHLKKRVGQMGKRNMQLENSVDLELEEAMVEVEQEQVVQITTKLCPACNNELDIVDIGIRELHMCPACKFHKAFKK